MIIIALAFMIILNISASIVLRMAGMASIDTKFLFGVLGWMGISGLFLFGLAGLLYAIILSKLSLVFVQCIAASQFIGIVFAARFFIGEPISYLKWSGISLIVLGILLVSIQNE